MANDLFEAIREGNLDAFQTFLKDAEIEAENDRGERALYVAAGKSSQAIKDALAEAGQVQRKPTISNPIVNNKLVIDVDTMDLAASLNVLIQVASDIDGTIYKHPDYSNRDGRLEFRFDSDGAEGFFEELFFFELCAENPPLRPLVEEYVRHIIQFNTKNGGEPVYVHDEQEAGGLAMEALLLTEDPRYLPLFLDYIAAIDIDHTVHLDELMDTVREIFSEEQLGAVNSHLEENGFGG